MPGIHHALVLLDLCSLPTKLMPNSLRKRNKLNHLILMIKYRCTCVAVDDQVARNKTDISMVKLCFKTIYNEFGVK